VIADLANRISQIEPRPAAIGVDFGFARVEFDGAVEISERPAIIFFAASRQAANTPATGALRGEFNAAGAVADRAVQVSNPIPGLAAIDAGYCT
jgi:hypothetical protein